LAKTTPYPPCHRDHFAAKVPGYVAGWLRRVTLTYFIAGPLGAINNRLLMKSLLTLIFLILTLTAYGQERDSSDIEIINAVEQMPIFPGGENGIWCFFESNFNFDILNEDQTQIKYFIRFIIDSLGKAKDFNFIATRPETINNLHLDSLKRVEILRVLNIMPQWEPALQNGKKISCWYMIPIKTPYTEFKCRKKRNNSP
jgi:hypothetical protein